LLTPVQIEHRQFKVGSLDQLMELMETFGKYDVMIDVACKKNE